MEAAWYRRLRPWLIILLLLGPAELRGAAADKELEGIKQKIASEKKDLSRLQAKEGSVVKALDQSGKDLAKKNRALKAAEAKYTALLAALEKTQAAVNGLRGSIAQRQIVFRQRMVALYRWQRRGEPVFFADGGATFTANLRHRRYLDAALAFDRELLGDLHSESQRQENLSRQLARHKEHLAAHKIALVAARAAVAQETEKQKTLLAALRQEKQSRQQSLREMEAAAQRLQKILDDIARRARVRPRETPPSPPPMARLPEAPFGPIDWPVKGKVSAPFGKFKHPEFAAEMMRKGIDIDAPMGESVRAAEKGRVVFADRLTGYGRMVIVDHGERFYTVYAHLSDIVKKTGDELARGAILGRVGDSDSPGGAKLYFELRKDGRSIDPLPWFRKG